MKIAIDGPAGAGKSTISKAVASHFDFVYIDTGAMYRCVGLAAVRKNLKITSENEIKKILDDIKIDIVNDGDTRRFYLNDEDVSEAIREPEISAAASDVATIPAVRLKLVDMQRELAKKHDVVMDGRDIGTYVLPNAELKIFLTASVAERARRRYDELCEKNINVTFEEVKSDMVKRDKNDSEREFAPLKPASDSVILDSTKMTINDVTCEIIKMIEEIRDVTL